MLTLYHAPRSRSSRFIWLLEELGAVYEIVPVSIRRRDGSGGPDPANPHPDRKVPALVHDGRLVTESAAIALYLTDEFPAKRIGPAIGDPKRGEYLSWLAYYAGVMEPVMATRATSPAEAEAMDRRLTQALEKAPYLLGDTFSAADILLASVMQFARSLLPPARLFDEHLARVTSRPAFGLAIAKDG